MADEENEIEAEATEAKPTPKKSKKKFIMLIGLVLFLLGGGGGGFYYWRVRAARAAALAAASPTPMKASKGAKSEKTEGAADDSEVTQVVELQPFIVNLADKTESRYLRMTISLGLGGEGEAKPDALFTTKIRNAILAVISTRTADEILTVEGKSALRKEMLVAAREAADEPKVLSIYITDFIIQM